MPTLVEWPRCKYCDTQDHVFCCSICGNWTCNDCQTTEVMMYDLKGFPIYKCHHERYTTVQNDDWK